MHIGELIKRKIAEKGFSFKEVADNMERTPQAIRDMISREHISTDNLLKLSEILEVNLFAYVADSYAFKIDDKEKMVDEVIKRLTALKNHIEEMILEINKFR